MITPCIILGWLVGGVTSTRIFIDSCSTGWIPVEKQGVVTSREVKKECLLVSFCRLKIASIVIVI